MGKDFESLLLNQQPDVHSLNAKSSALPFGVGLQRVSSPFAAPCANNTVSTNGNRPISSIPLPPDAKESHGWFYCLPRFRQGFISGANMVHYEKSLPGMEPPEKVPAPTTGSSPKQFLVFDQSGDKTTLIYSSDIGTSLCLNPWNLNTDPLVKSNNADTGMSGLREMHNISGPSLTDELNVNYSEAEDNGEMREDSEEINALLYSDDDSAQYDDDSDDEASTGHSPSLTTAYNDDKQDWFEVEDREEVASSDRPVKRQRISVDGCHAASELDNASSAKLIRSIKHEDDTESKCSMRDSKRSRKERIRETIEILERIIPGAEGKDAAMVLDESIQYLRSLKNKAKSLGLSSL